MTTSRAPNSLAEHVLPGSRIEHISSQAAAGAPERDVSGQGGYRARVLRAVERCKGTLVARREASPLHGEASLVMRALLVLVVWCASACAKSELPPALDGAVDRHDALSDTSALDTTSLDTPVDTNTSSDTSSQLDASGPSDAPPDVADAPVDAPPDVVDASPSCAIGQTFCSETCVDVQSSPSHCGGCGRACASGQVCSGGMCAMTCGAGTMRCGDACVDLTTNVAHCGACSRACPTLPNSRPACGTGICGFLCNTGFADCNGMAFDGCEVDITTVLNCGRCDNLCSGGTNTAPTCESGTCRIACVPGFADCDMNPVNGCEANLADPASCGTCGRRCNPGETCRTTAGTTACACPSGQTSCGAAGCFNLSTDANNCGGCGIVCTGGRGCSSGVCACPGGTVECSGTCVNLNTNPGHCGACRMYCGGLSSEASVGCVAGRCTCALAVRGDCDTNRYNGCETSIYADPANCGMCGNACSGATPRCVAGVCTACGGAGQPVCATAPICNANFTPNPLATPRGATCTACGANTTPECVGVTPTCAVSLSACPVTVSGQMYNTCFDLQSTATHCGACGATCVGRPSTMNACELGRCTCVSGRGDCDTMRANGCESDFSNDDNNCGSCGNRCPAGGSCTGGRCACRVGETMCGTGASAACVDLQTSTTNCGACGRICDGAACTGGSCLVQRSCATSGTPGCGLVSITGGTFEMGEASSTYNASPVQTGIRVGNFALDAYEVTVARFNAYWSVRSRDMAAVRGSAIVYPGGQTIAWGGTGASPTAQDADNNWSATSSSRDAHPMNGVDYWMAQEFCVWDGGRLPTEAEWEYAARGRAVGGLGAARVYPWGNTDPSRACDRAHWNLCAGADGGRTRRVGSFAATEGLYDLAGNVWEWTADNYGDYPSCWLSTTNPLCNNSATGFRVRRGGAWSDSVVAAHHSASRGVNAPANHNSNVGFRCARITCVAGTNNCAGVCRDLQTDLANCGGCGTACPAGQVCSRGACTVS